MLHDQIFFLQRRCKQKSEICIDISGPCTDTLASLTCGAHHNGRCLRRCTNLKAESQPANLMLVCSINSIPSCCCSSSHRHATSQWRPSSPASGRRGRGSRPSPPPPGASLPTPPSSPAEGGAGGFFPHRWSAWR